MSGGGPVEGRRVALGRLAIAAAVLTVLLAADALWMQLTGYQAADRNGFGLTDAGTVYVAAALLLVATVVLLVLRRGAARRGR